MLSQRSDNLDIFLIETLGGSEWWMADIVRVIKVKFGVSRDTVIRVLQRLVADGKLEKVRYGRRFKFRLNPGFL